MRFVLVSLLLTAAPSPAPAPAPDDAAAVQSLVARFRTAVEKEDAPTLLSLFWPEAIVFEHGGVDRDARAFVDGHLKPHFQSMSFRWLDEDNSGRLDVPLGYVAQRATLEVTDGDGPPRKVPNTFTFVLRKKEGAWRIAHLHWSLGKAEAAPLPAKP